MDNVEKLEQEIDYAKEKYSGYLNSPCGGDYFEASSYDIANHLVKQGYDKVSEVMSEFIKDIIESSFEIDSDNGIAYKIDYKKFKELSLKYIGKKDFEKIIWDKNFKAKSGKDTCNTCNNYDNCSKDDIDGEYYNSDGAATHNGSRACKYYEKDEIGIETC